MGMQGQIPTGVATGVPGALFAKEVLTNIPTLQTFVPAAGNYYAFSIDAGIVTEVQDSTGAWRTVAAAGVNPGNFETDGTNLRFRQSGAGTGAISLIKLG